MSATLEAACRAASLFFMAEIKPSFIKVRSKRREYTHPRHFVMAWMYRTGRLSHPQVVRLCGRKDHTTSMNAIVQSDKRYAEDPEYRRLMAYAPWWANAQTGLHKERFIVDRSTAG